ncbi:MAG: hypothetical protein WD960_08460 [Gemmatimonadota bacterium]
MTKLLERAFREAAKLSPEEQDAVAALLLAELESEQRWSEVFRGSQHALGKLAREALAADERGETEDLDPSTM